MTRIIGQLMSLTLLHALILTGFGFAQPETTDDLLRDLQGGGYVLYFRHAATVWSQGDQVSEAADWMSCDPDRMRQLSEEGRQASREIGSAIQALNIPVSQVAASEYCRAAETAELMDLGEVELTTDILNTRSAIFVGGRRALVTRARGRLSAVPELGENTVLVAHGNVVSAAADISLTEGEAAVFRPLGEGQFEFVATVGPETWAQRLGR